ncbi:hypothetical protein EVAR_51516_1 [Eumeta japonica]|uniref:Uncharacterized protein n=1 Tax=Eumeta variegata TaxID=151549 RepID=A0A4C1XCM5_EUMVA|nr:hypothetical protein EVAR_51516_1 [Eumeta japonica]
MRISSSYCATRGRSSGAAFALPWKDEHRRFVDSSNTNNVVYRLQLSKIHNYNRVSRRTSLLGVRSHEVLAKTQRAHGTSDNLNTRGHSPSRRAGRRHISHFLKLRLMGLTLSEPPPPPRDGRRLGTGA